MLVNAKEMLAKAKKEVTATAIFQPDCCDSPGKADTYPPLIGLLKASLF